MPAGAQNMLSHLIDADTHKYTPFCSTSANQGRRFQKARGMLGEKHISLPRRLLFLTPCSFSSHFFLVISFSPDISFPWHFFLLTSLLLAPFFCLTSLFLHASSLEIFPLTCQTHLHSNLAQQLIGRAGVGLQSTKAGLCVAHSKLSMLSCQKRMSETQQVTVHFSSVWKGIFQRKMQDVMSYKVAKQQY